MGSHFTCGTPTILLRVVVLVLLAATHCSGALFTFTRVADSSTSIPGGSGSFTAFGTLSLDGGNVAFRGMGAGGQDGIYLLSGGALTVVADTSNLIPGTASLFTGFSPVSLKGSTVAFVGGGKGIGGVYTNLGGSLRVVADNANNIPIPGGSGNFTGADQASFDGNIITFIGFGQSGQRGVYREIGGALVKVADLSTSIPDGTGTFTGLSTWPASGDGNKVAFSGSGLGQQGIYVSDGNVLTRIADRGTQIPDGVGTFSEFDPPVLDGDAVAFRAVTSDQRGIYTTIGGPLSRVADKTTLIPDGIGSFENFGQVSIDDGYIAFQATGVGQNGIYTTLGGSLAKVIDQDDTLDGKSFDTNVAFSVLAESLRGDSIAFRAFFDDGSSGIYLATAEVPEPSTVMIWLVFGVLIVLHQWRRRLRQGLSNSS